MLPKYLIADNLQEQPDNVFVIRTQEPRFIIQGSITNYEHSQKIYWIDEPKSEKEIKNLLNEAKNFYIQELEHQEISFDLK